MQLDPKADLLCVYGGRELSSPLKQWLEKDPARHLFFLHEKEEVSTFLGGHEHPRLRRWFISQEGEEELCKQIAWEAVFSSLAFFAFPTLDEQGKNRCRTLFEKISYYQTGVDLIASDYSDMGKQLFTNVTKNICSWGSAKKGCALSLSLKGIPAIICGAGPSLRKNIHHLRGLAERALLFGGGSSLKALSNAHVIPHLSAAIDPGPSSALFAEQKAFETPFFYQHRVCNRLLSLVHAPRLWMPDQGALLLERFLCEGSEEDSFDGGWNVATFALAIAEKFGCNPIILVGMDLSMPNPADGLVATRDSEGKVVYARRDWLVAKEWVEDFASTHSHMRFINATEGGLGFKGIPTATLESVMLTELSSQWDIRGAVHAAIEQCSKVSTSHEAIKRCCAIKESLKTTHALCMALIKEFEESYPTFPCEKGSFILKQVELEEELSTQKILMPIWQVWRHPFARRIKDPQQRLLNQFLFYKRVIEEISDGSI